MRLQAAVLVLFVATSLSAEGSWTLRKGPTAVEVIPLDPLQPVSAWRAQYSDGNDSLWLYVTQSPQFFPPRSPLVVAIPPTPWTVVLFPPKGWSPETTASWLARWLTDFRTLATLPDPGFPIVLPAVLTKG